MHPDEIASLSYGSLFITITIYHIRWTVFLFTEIFSVFVEDDSTTPEVVTLILKYFRQMTCR